jgi:hypothetical protein
VVSRVAVGLSVDEHELGEREDLQVPREAHAVLEAEEAVDVGLGPEGERVVAVSLANFLLVAGAVRALEERREPGIDEVCRERAGEVNVLLPEAQGEGAEDAAERPSDLVIEEAADVRRVSVIGVDEIVEAAERGTAPRRAWSVRRGRACWRGSARSSR